MNAARILYPVKVLGPGDRVGLWLCGCKRGCPGCSNPEVWHPRPEYEVSVEELYRLVDRIAAQHPVDGFTISGGEPFDQPKELAQLLEKLCDISTDILIYTGYPLQQLQSMENNDVQRLLSLAAVIIDGPYIEQQNTGVPLRGSANQTVHLLRPELAERYDRYLTDCKNPIQNFATQDGIVSVGIHRPGFTPHIG